jgi:hypothetical protein
MTGCPGWHGEQWYFQNNEKTIKRSDHWIMTGWHGEQWDFQNKKRQWKIAFAPLYLN